MKGNILQESAQGHDLVSTQLEESQIMLMMSTFQCYPILLVRVITNLS